MMIWELAERMLLFIGILAVGTSVLCAIVYLLPWRAVMRWIDLTQAAMWSTVWLVACGRRPYRYISRSTNMLEEKAITMSGWARVTVVSETTHKILDHFDIHWKDEPEAKTRVIQAAIGQALFEVSKSGLFGHDFNPGYRTDWGEVVIHFNSQGTYSNGQRASRTDHEQNRCDSVDVEAVRALILSIDKLQKSA